MNNHKKEYISRLIKAIQDGESVMIVEPKPEEPDVWYLAVSNPDYNPTEISDPYLAFKFEM